MLNNNISAAIYSLFIFWILQNFFWSNLVKWFKLRQIVKPTSIWLTISTILFVDYKRIKTSQCIIVQADEKITAFFCVQMKDKFFTRNKNFIMWYIDKVFVFQSLPFICIQKNAVTFWPFFRQCSYLFRKTVLKTIWCPHRQWNLANQFWDCCSLSMVSSPNMSNNFLWACTVFFFPFRKLYTAKYIKSFLTFFFEKSTSNKRSSTRSCIFFFSNKLEQSDFTINLQLKMKVIYITRYVITLKKIENRTKSW